MNKKLAKISSARCGLHYVSLDGSPWPVAPMDLTAHFSTADRLAIGRDPDPVSPGEAGTQTLLPDCPPWIGRRHATLLRISEGETLEAPYPKVKIG